MHPSATMTAVVRRTPPAMTARTVANMIPHPSIIQPCPPSRRTRRRLGQFLVDIASSIVHCRLLSVRRSCLLPSCRRHDGGRQSRRTQLRHNVVATHSFSQRSTFERVVSSKRGSVRTQVSRHRPVSTDCPRTRRHTPIRDRCDAAGRASQPPSVRPILRSDAPSASTRRDFADIPVQGRRPCTIGSPIRSIRRMVLSGALSPYSCDPGRRNRR